MTISRPSVLRVAAISALLIAGAIVPQVRGARGEGKGSYFPLSVGDEWVYGLHRRAAKTETTVKWTVTQMETVQGSAVYYLWQRPAQGDEPLGLSETKNGVAEAGTERVLLKYPLQAGDRWSGKSQSLKAKGKSFAFEVIEAGKPCGIGGQFFDDCAVVREVDGANDVTSLTTYARGVGPVKYVYFKGIHSDEADDTMVIKSWHVR
jgi:hypothetical protein